jgi:hypothetical protein
MIFQPKSCLERTGLFKQMQQASAMPTLAWRLEPRGMPALGRAASILLVKTVASTTLYLSASSRL